MSDTTDTPVRLRTANWYEGTSRDNFIHRSWMKRGLPDDGFLVGSSGSTVGRESH